MSSDYIKFFCIDYIKFFCIAFYVVLLNFFYRFFLSGAGEPNFDSFESNPFQNTKQRQEQEIQTLMQKLSHEMIGLDASFIGSLDKGNKLI